MEFCVSCGHALSGVGRFCTNCGHPIGMPPPAGWRTDTAERAVPRVPAPPPEPPPSPAAGSVPSAPRFPLYADEVAPPGPEPHPPTPHRRPSRAPWIALAVALVLLLGLGGWLLARDDDGGAAAPAKHQSRSGSPHGAGSASPGPAAPDGLTAGAEVTVPETAPPNRDVQGNPVSYEAAHLLDGVPETCWRMPGDGTGTEITVTLAHRAHLRSVGLVNGYAKSAEDARGRELDWYHGNRRVLAVQWVFDDGSTVDQTLEDATAVQSVDVDVTTRTVTLRLVSVSKPGTGRAARDYTAISELSLVGAS